VGVRNTMTQRSRAISATTLVTRDSEETSRRILSTSSPSRGQSGAIQPDLAQLAAGNRLRSFNRTAARLTDAARTGARLSEAPGDGVGALEPLALPPRVAWYADWVGKLVELVDPVM